MRRALLLVSLLLSSVATATVRGEADAAERALAWLADAPNPPQPPYLVEASAQAGRDPARWPTPATSVFAKLSPYGSPDGPYYSYLRVAHAAGTSGYDPRDVNGLDLVQLVREGYSNGQFGNAAYVNDDIWAILALRAAGVPATDEQVRAAALHVKARQLPDGGWSHAFPALRGSTDVTGAALAALKAAGEDTSAMSDARAFLDGTLHPRSGGHDDNVGTTPNCQSTTWAIHGYAALGDEARPETLAFLRSLQRASGALATSANGTENAFCTAEAVVALAGARYPLPSFEPLAPPRPAAHVGEPVALALDAPFTRASWTVAGATHEGTRVELSFAKAGTYPYRLHAEGPGVRTRVEGAITILSAPPVLGEFPANVSVLRRAPVTLDLSNASDPDGAVARFEIDWGDGTRTLSSERRPSHAYAEPGTYRIVVRAFDDAGVASEPARIGVSVVNRPPTIAPLTRAVGDRVAGATLHVNATDPEGDRLEGAGARVVRPGGLGEHLVEVVVRDPYGGEARANVTVEVVNLAPRLAIGCPPDARADADVALVAEASDPDGAPPTVAWRIGGATYAGARVALRLPAGAHTLHASATDADGATTNASAPCVVAGEATPARPAKPPEIRSLDAYLSGGTLFVLFEASGDATVHWESDAGGGERARVKSPVAVPLAGATWATVTLEAARDGLIAARESGLVRAPQPIAAGGAVEARASEPVLVQPEVASVEKTLAQAAISEAPPSPRDPQATPLAWWLPALALATLAATRGRRAK